MIIDNIDLTDLPSNQEEAFVEYDRRLREALRKAREEDRQIHYDRDGDYNGDYSPERYYVSSTLAFLDEYGLDDGSLTDITGLENYEFKRAFSKFFNDINYMISRFKLRSGRMSSGAAGTPIEFASTYKEEASKLLATIRKIVEQEVADQNKKDAILRKVAALQSEIDRDRTTVDAVFSRLIEFSKVAGEVGKNIEPLVEKIERLKKVFFEGVVEVDLLPRPNRKKALPKPEENLQQSVDDEIPF